MHLFWSQVFFLEFFAEGSVSVGKDSGMDCMLYLEGGYGADYGTSDQGVYGLVYGDGITLP